MYHKKVAKQPRFSKKAHEQGDQSTRKNVAIVAGEGAVVLENPNSNPPPFADNLSTENYENNNSSGPQTDNTDNNCGQINDENDFPQQKQPTESFESNKADNDMNRKEFANNVQVDNIYSTKFTVPVHNNSEEEQRNDIAETESVTIQTPKSVIFEGGYEMNGDSGNSSPSLLDLGNLMTNLRESTIGRKIQEGFDKLDLKQQSSVTKNTIANIPNFILIAVLAIFGFWVIGTTLFFLIFFVSVPLVFILPAVFIGIVILDLVGSAFRSLNTIRANKFGRNEEIGNRKIFVKVGNKEDIDGSKLPKAYEFAHKKKGY